MHTFGLNSPIVCISFRLSFNKLNENLGLSHCDVKSKIHSFVGRNRVLVIQVSPSRTPQPSKTRPPQLNVALDERGCWKGVKRNGMNKNRYKHFSQPVETEIMRMRMHQFKLTKS